MYSHAHVQLSNSYPFSKPASSKLQLWITDVHCTIIMQTARHGGSPCPKLVDYRWCGSARNACKSGYFRSTTAWTIYHFWTLCHFCDVDIWCSCESGYFRSTRMEIFMMMISMRSLDSDIQKTYELAQMYRVFFSIVPPNFQYQNERRLAANQRFCSMKYSMYKRSSLVQQRFSI